MPHFLERISNGLLTMLGLLLIAMVGLSVWNVISRYLFDNALLWADEVATFSVIALAYLGAVVCAWRGTDLRMDIVVNLLPRRLQFVLCIVQQLVITGLTGWVAWLSYGYVARVFRVGMRSTGADLPLWIIHAIVPFSLLLIALIAALRLLSLLSQGADALVTVAAAAEVTKK